MNTSCPGLVILVNGGIILGFVSLGVLVFLLVYAISTIWSQFDMPGALSRWFIIIVICGLISNSCFCCRLLVVLLIACRYCLRYVRFDK